MGGQTRHAWPATPPGYPRQPGCSASALANRIVDVAPAFDGPDMGVNRRQVCPHRDDRDVASSGVAPRRDVAGPLVVAAAVLLDRLKTKGAGIPSEFAEPGFDPRLDLDRLG